MQISKKNTTHKYHSQTVRARELTFWEKVHLPPPVTCHVSHVMCYMSRITCHMSHVTFLYIFFLFTKWLSLSVEGLLSIGLPRHDFYTLRYYDRFCPRHWKQCWCLPNCFVLASYICSIGHTLKTLYVLCQDYAKNKKKIVIYINLVLFKKKLLKK